MSIKSLRLNQNQYLRLFGVSRLSLPWALPSPLPLSRLILTSFRLKWGVSECARIHERVCVFLPVFAARCSELTLGRVSCTAVYGIRIQIREEMLGLLYCRSATEPAFCQAAAPPAASEHSVKTHADLSAGASPCTQTIISPKHLKLKSCRDGWLSNSRRYCPRSPLWMMGNSSSLHTAIIYIDLPPFVCQLPGHAVSSCRWVERVGGGRASRFLQSCDADAFSGISDK